MCLVCLIDDDAVQHFIVDRLLVKNRGVEKRFYFNAALALRDIENNLDTPEKIPDIIILDINMPLMDGWQFLDGYQRLLKYINKQVRIYMLSSSIDSQDIMRLKAYHFVEGFFSKPLTTEQAHLISSYSFSNS